MVDSQDAHQVRRLRAASSLDAALSVMGEGRQKGRPGKRSCASSLAALMTIAYPKVSDHMDSNLHPARSYGGENVVFCQKYV